MRTAALADVLLLVVSKDKYADQCVWTTLELLLPLKKPLIVCINKITEESLPIIVRSFRSRYEALSTSSEELLLTTISYQKDLDSAATQIAPEEANALTNELQQAFTAVQRAHQEQNTYAFIERHWDDWVAPIVAEHAAEKAWEAQISRLVEQALANYRRDYLDNPQNYETFKQALAELLSLLEVPGLAQPLLQARKIVTWPARQLINLGKSLTGSEPQKEFKGISFEQRLLTQICEHIVTHLAEEALRISESDTGDSGWWKDIGRLLRHQRQAIRARFETSLTDYQQAFQPEIEKAAQALYDKLKQQPATLNSLRAARVTADAAAVALALKTGGISVHDFVFAPAMLAVTSILTESALGHYMDKTEAQLKTRQYETVKTKLLEVLQGELLALKDKLDPNQRFLVPAERFSAAEEQIRAHHDR